MKTKIVLDADASHRTMEMAIRTQSQVVLEFPAYPQHTIQGCLISGDQKALLIELSGRPSLNPEDLINATCQVRVYSDQRYQFTSEVTAAPLWGESRSLALTRPSSLAVLDRRQFVRARLAPSSRVLLEWTRNGEGHRHTGSLLNISADGLACRIEDHAVQALEGGESIRVRFEIPGGVKPFDLAVTISNKTPASSDHTIVGLQFQRTADQSRQLDTLKDLLTRQFTIVPEAEALA